MFETKSVDYLGVEYQAGVLIRKELFFKGFPNNDKFIHDRFEENAYHVVAYRDDLVVGTGRLNIVGGLGYISQMAVQPIFQGMGVGFMILYTLEYKCKEEFIGVAELDARISGLPFYEKAGYHPIGGRFPSEKTGVEHQRMRKHL